MTLKLSTLSILLGLVIGLPEKNDIIAMTPNGSTKNSTNSSSAGASSQAIGAGRDAVTATGADRGVAMATMGLVSWPKAMLRSTPKDSADRPC